MSYNNISINQANRIMEICGITARNPTPINNYGQSNVIFTYDPEFVLKIQTDPNRYNNLKRESLALTSVKDNMWWPEVIAEGAIEEIGYYLILKRIPGIPLSESCLKLTAKEQIDIGKQLGEIILQLHHSRSFKICGDFFFEYDNMKHFLLEQYETVINDLKILDNNSFEYPVKINKIISKIDSFITKYLDEHVNESGYCLIHNDLHIGNILFNPDRMEITGIIDFELSQKSIPTLEILKLYYSVHWPRRYVFPSDKLRRAYNKVNLLPILEGFNNIYDVDENFTTNPFLIFASINYDLESLRKSILNAWHRSIEDNLKRLEYTTDYVKLYHGSGWL